MARLDVLMPLYNRAETVAAAWNSLARQTFTDFRVVAVDDGSTDETAATLTAAAQGDPRLEVIERSHGGIVAALNTGLGAVSAPVVVRMDGDDQCHPRRLAVLLELLADPRVGVAGTRVAAFPDHRLTPGMSRYLAWQNSLLGPDEHLHDRFVESTLAHGSAAIRTAELAAAGSWSAARGPEDLDLWLRLHQRRVRFVKSPEMLYYWRQRRGSETRGTACSDDAFHRCRRKHLVIELQSRGVSRVGLLGVGRTLSRWAEELEAAGFEVRPVAHKPGHPLSKLTHDLVVACYGALRPRQRVRAALSRTGAEGDRFLFVGS